MTGRNTIAAAVLTCLFGLSTASFADKTTVDPNTVQKPAPAEIADKRLDQKITYESLDKRLHSVLDDLTAMTGVTVRCGDSKNDWQVRDLPLVVCARDLPLGKLLRTIADCTHLAAHQLRERRRQDLSHLAGQGPQEAVGGPLGGGRGLPGETRRGLSGDVAVDVGYLGTARPSSQDRPPRA